MAHLIVYHQGKQFARLDLLPGQAYTIGRDPNADICLTSTKGISRQHLKISEKSGNWFIQVLSRFGNLIYEGERVDELLLDVNTQFKLPPYDFNFIIEAESLPANPLTSTEEKSTIETGPPQPIAPQKNHEEKKIDETTISGASHLVGVIKWVDKVRGKRGFKLATGSCIVGRVEACDITINSKLMSRRHFEVSRVRDTFYVVDLGSANGTLLNGKPVSKNQPLALHSGDQITVMGTKFKFEIVDAQFDKRLDRVPQSLQSLEMPTPPPEAGARVVRVHKNQHIVISDSSAKKKLIRYGILAMIPILLFLMLSGENKEGDGREELSLNSIPFEKLDKEQKAVVRDSFNLAKNHFLQNKHALCLAEVKKLHEIIPFYENSKEIENLCEQALDLERMQQDKARKEKEQRYIEQRIQVITEDCRTKLDAFKNPSEARSCISAAIDLAPEHPMVNEFLTAVEIREQQKREAEEAQRQRQVQIHKGENLYRTAVSYYKKEEYSKAINNYQKFLSGAYPDPNGYRDNAKREVASAQEKLAKVVAEKFNECKKLYNDRKYKESILACDKVLKEDPQSEAAKEFRRKVLSELRKEMKLIYEDSILEESLGNIDAAIEKWKKIMDLDLPSDDYYSKAKSKLKKRGIGM